jgi:membrane protein YqaA with SNARE-associated domain
MNALLAYAFHLTVISASLAAFFALALWVDSRLRPSTTPADLPWHKRIDLRFRNFCESNGLVLLVAVWAALEATVWFIIPEFALLITIFLRRVSAKMPILWADLAGSAVGASIAYVVGALAGPGWIVHVPYVTGAMLQQATTWMDCLGTWGLIFQPYSGVPFKVFGVAASSAGVGFLAFLGFGLTVRLQRYILVLGLFVALQRWKGEWIARHFWKWIPLAIAVFALGLIAGYGTYGPSYEEFETFKHTVQGWEAATGRRILRC